MEAKIKRLKAEQDAATEYSMETYQHLQATHHEVEGCQRQMHSRLTQAKGTQMGLAMSSTISVLLGTVFFLGVIGGVLYIVEGVTQTAGLQEFLPIGLLICGVVLYKLLAAIHAVKMPEEFEMHYRMKE